MTNKGLETSRTTPIKNTLYYPDAVMDMIVVAVDTIAVADITDITDITDIVMAVVAEEASG